MSAKYARLTNDRAPQCASIKSFENTADSGRYTPSISRQDAEVLTELDYKYNIARRRMKPGQTKRFVSQRPDVSG